MNEVELTVGLECHFLLGLPDGLYPTTSHDESHPGFREISVFEMGNPPRTYIGLTATVSAASTRHEKERTRTQLADRLLHQTNRLLRWARAVQRRGEIPELSRAMASPFIFSITMDDDPESWDDSDWIKPLEYLDDGPLPVTSSLDERVAQILSGLESGRDPDVEVLFVLDAEHALSQGRFREAVLLSWSTIDSVFIRKYDALVEAELADEWAEGRKALTARDFGLRNKMTFGLRLAAGRSLFHEPGDFWARLSASYAIRNDIIHSGRNANEAQARSAITLAEDMIRIMAEIPDRSKENA